MYMRNFVIGRLVYGGNRKVAKEELTREVGTFWGRDFCDWPGNTAMGKMVSLEC